MNIVLVDDHPVVRKGLKSILEEDAGFTVCGEAEDANTAIKIISETEPELVIVDIELKGNIDGIELVGAIKVRFPRIKMLVMSMDDGTLYAEKSIKVTLLWKIEFISAVQFQIRLLQNIFTDHMTIRR
ncbi:MAG: hypothetical protein CVV49_02935 [Spirochaetae bacterium HGW-Spirochaetae-5]|nr:MAG: hypothetical protein CVV49_02935 [Spirochaetae bacterium HGW-Spirochaetae-5]